jgi:uncharacterized protein YbjT (DUF2867 family)
VIVAVPGGTLGDRLAAELSARGHAVREAAAGADAVVAIGGGEAPSSRRLLAEALAAGVPHLLSAGLVGADLVPADPYAADLGREQQVMASGRGWSVLRTTHLHDEVWDWLGRRCRRPVVVVAAGTRLQPLDPAVVARMLADAVETGPAGRLPDVGGPFAYEVADLARSHLAATGKRRLVAPLNRPGIAGAALRAGAALCPHRDRTGTTWNDFVRRKMAGG